MPRPYETDTPYDTDFEARIRDRQTWNAKFWRFTKYLSTRRIECWGFFIAGMFIGGIIL